MRFIFLFSLLAVSSSSTTTTTNPPTATETVIATSVPNEELQHAFDLIFSALVDSWNSQRSTTTPDQTADEQLGGMEYDKSIEGAPLLPGLPDIAPPMDLFKQLSNMMDISRLLQIRTDASGSLASGLASALHGSVDLGSLFRPLNLEVASLVDPGHLFSSPRQSRPDPHHEAPPPVERFSDPHQRAGVPKLGRGFKQSPRLSHDERSSPSGRAYEGRSHDRSRGSSTRGGLKRPSRQEPQRAPTRIQSLDGSKPGKMGSLLQSLKDKRQHRDRGIDAGEGMEEGLSLAGAGVEDDDHELYEQGEADELLEEYGCLSLDALELCLLEATGESQTTSTARPTTSTTSMTSNVAILSTSRSPTTESQAVLSTVPRNRRLLHSADTTTVGMTSQVEMTSTTLSTSLMRSTVDLSREALDIVPDTITRCCERMGIEVEAARDEVDTENGTIA